MKHLTHIILVVLICVVSSAANGQENQPTETNNAKNALYLSAGTSVLWHGASVTYERTLQENMFNRPISSFAKLGLGYYLMWDWEPNYGGPWTFSHYGLLFGKKSHHFEFSAGVMYAFSGDLEGFFPSGTIGYRYHKPEENFIFRANVSFPEALNLGVGFTF